MIRTRTLLVIVLMSLLTGIASAQTPPIASTPRFGSFGGGPDIINLGNLNSHISIPVFSKSGRGLSFDFFLTYDSSVWYPVTSGSTTSWTPVANFGWDGSDLKVGHTTYKSNVSTSICSPRPNLKFITTITYSNWTYHDGFGRQHHFPGASTVRHDSCDGVTTTTGFSSTETDGFGYVITVNGNAVSQLVGPDGSLITAPINTSVGAGKVQDRNGNFISEDSNGNFTDTLGLVAITTTGNVTAPPTVYTYTAPSGAAAHYTVSYITRTVKTNFGCGFTEYGPTSNNLVDRVTLPDGTFYQFNYEATPGFSGDYTGRLASVTLPAGGTITYSYSGGSDGITCADGSAATLTRTTPDGTWTYTHSESGTAWTTTVTDPQNNQTVLNFQGIYETQRQVYQGGTLLLTTNTCYNGSASPCNGTAISLPITQRTVVTTLPGNLQSKHFDSYSAFGMPTEIDDYDYASGAPGALLRAVTITYAPLGNNLSLIHI